MNRPIWFLLTVSLVLSPLLFSNTINVPADYLKIQLAIDAAVNGDTILVAPGIYLENIDFLGKAIKVRSEQGPNMTVIDGGMPPSSTFGCVVAFQGGEGADSIINGFTLINGCGYLIDYNYYFKGGGGIFCTNNSSPTIVNNIIVDNNAYSGGGIYCEENSSPFIINNLITNNDAVLGGSIYSYLSSPIIIDNNITCNEAKYSIYGGGCGGGIYSRDGDIVISNNLITSNKALTGGGMYCVGSNGTTTISENIIYTNNASSSDNYEGGGGINCNGDNVKIFNNIINDNTAYKGGGIFNSGNSKIINNTISRNNAVQQGGGIYSRASVPIILNTIIWNNDAPADSEIVPYLQVHFSNIKGGYPGTSNIDADPLFVDLNNGDFHLTYVSPCRDVGDNSAVQGFYDFEGDPRICHGTVDMGADECYRHLYVTGNSTPGGGVYLNFIGLPGTYPVGLLIGSKVLEPSLPSMWGMFYIDLSHPWSLYYPLPAIPSNGVMSLFTNIPSSPPAPYDVPMQALIGLNADSLSNLCVLDVR